MPGITYAEGRIRYVNEDRLAVAFARDTNQVDGSIAGKQYLNLRAGGWNNEFEPVEHLRALDRDPMRPNRQSFAAPDDFLVQPQGVAEIYVVDSKGAIVSDFASLESNHAYSLVRRFASMP